MGNESACSEQKPSCVSFEQIHFPLMLGLVNYCGLMGEALRPEDSPFCAPGPPVPRTVLSARGAQLQDGKDPRGPKQCGATLTPEPCQGRLRDGSRRGEGCKSVDGPAVPALRGPQCYRFGEKTCFSAAPRTLRGCPCPWPRHVRTPSHRYLRRAPVPAGLSLCWRHGRFFGMRDIALRIGTIASDKRRPT